MTPRDRVPTAKVLGANRHEVGIRRKRRAVRLAVAGIPRRLETRHDRFDRGAVRRIDRVAHRAVTST